MLVVSTACVCVCCGTRVTRERSVTNITRDPPPPLLVHPFLLVHPAFHPAFSTPLSTGPQGTIGHAVTSPEDTMQQCRELFF